MTGYLALSLVPILWGTYSPSIRYLYAEENPLDPASLTAIRTALSASALLLPVVLKYLYSEGSNALRRLQHGAAHHGNASSGGESSPAAVVGTQPNNAETGTARVHAGGAPVAAHSPSLPHTAMPTDNHTDVDFDIHHAPLSTVLAGTADGPADGIAAAAAVAGSGEEPPSSRSSPSSPHSALAAAATAAAPGSAQQAAPLFDEPLLTARLGPVLTRTFSGVVLGGLELGLLNFMGTALQVEGLHSTSATRAGFLAEVTAVLTPLVSYAAGYDIPRQMWAAVAVGLVGSTLVAYDTSQASTAAAAPVASTAAPAPAGAAATGAAAAAATGGAGSTAGVAAVAAAGPSAVGGAASGAARLVVAPPLASGVTHQLAADSQATAESVPVMSADAAADATVAAGPLTSTVVSIAPSSSGAPGLDLAEPGSVLTGVPTDVASSDVAISGDAGAGAMAALRSTADLAGADLVAGPAPGTAAGAADAAVTVFAGDASPASDTVAVAAAAASELAGAGVDILGPVTAPDVAEVVSSVSASLADGLATAALEAASSAAAPLAVAADAAADAATAAADTASAALGTVGSAAVTEAVAAAVTAAEAVTAAAAPAATTLAITGGEAYLLLACLFFSICTVRMGIYAPKLDTAQLAAMKKIGLSSASLLWMAASNLQHGASPGSVFAFPDLSSRPPLSVAVLLYSGLGPGALATYLQFAGLATVPATTAQVIYSAMPLCTAFFAYWLLGGEATGPLAWAGGGLIIAAALMAASAQYKQQQQQEQQQQEMRQQAHQQAQQKE